MAVASVVSVEESLYDEDLGEVSGRSTHLEVAPGLLYEFSVIYLGYYIILCYIRLSVANGASTWHPFD